MEYGPTNKGVVMRDLLLPS